MQITIFGSGYVGLVTGACMAEAGNHVVCVDIDEDKVRRLNEGDIPIYEPGLEDYIERNVEAGRLTFTTDIARGIDHGLFLFIAVGTPPDEDGSADLKHVLDVARSIGEHLDTYRIVVDKSTVPVGTADKVCETIRSVLNERGVEIDFDVASNPEFLKEGAAIDDFMKPDRIVVGTDNPRTAELLRALYEPFNRNHERVITMDVRSAELTKYAANAMLATKISFMNELANIAERAGADIEKVRVGIGSDPRIGYQFIYPGAGYGGSCFPKDVRALAHSARNMGYKAELLDSVETVNNRQKERLFEKISERYGGDVAGRTIAIWGLAFKPKTDDMREASSRTLIEKLWDAGANVRAYDPEAMDEARRIYGERSELVLCENAYDALKGADALAIVTEWQEFRSPNFDAIRETLADPVIFDGRNIYDPEILDMHGLSYFAIGRSNLTGDAAPQFGRRKTDKVLSAVGALAVALGTLLAASPADAQQQGWQFEPVVRLGYESDDNAQLDFRTDQEISLDGFLADVVANIMYDSPRTQFQLAPRLLSRNYSDESDFDSDDLFLNIDYLYIQQSSDFGFQLGYDKQQVRNAERADADLDIEDPQDIADDETGRVGTFGERKRWRFLPSWSQQLSQSSTIGLNARYTNVRYDDVFQGILTDYDDLRFTAAYRYAYSPTASVIVRGSGRSYESKGIDPQAELDGYGLVVGIERDMSDTTQLRAIIGAESSDVQNQDSETEIVGEIVLRRRLETIKLLARYERLLNSSGSGQVTLRDSVNLSATRQLNEKLSAGLGVRAYQDDPLGQSANVEDRQYVQIRARATWYLTAAFSAEFDYRYTVLDRGDVVGESGNSNQINIWFAYHPNSPAR